MIFASSKKVLAYFGVADSIKENAPDVIGQLKDLGVKTIMLTGDNEKAARQIADKVGVDRAKGNLLPEDKQSLVDSIAKREVIGMVGTASMTLLLLLVPISVLPWALPERILRLKLLTSP